MKASGEAGVRGPAGREEDGQRMVTVKLSPLLRWVKVARPAAAEVVLHPAIGCPAPARKLVKSADAVPQSMLRLETVYPPAGRYVEPARSLWRTVKPMPAHALSRVDPPVFEPGATTRRLLIEATWRLPKRSVTE